jgi:hypothetical protein
VLAVRLLLSLTFILIHENKGAATGEWAPLLTTIHQDDETSTFVRWHVPIMSSIDGIGKDTNRSPNEVGATQIPLGQLPFSKLPDMTISCIVPDLAMQSRRNGRVDGTGWHEVCGQDGGQQRQCIFGTHETLTLRFASMTYRQPCHAHLGLPCLFRRIDS